MDSQEVIFERQLGFCLGDPEARKYYLGFVAKGINDLKRILGAAAPSLRPTWIDAMARIIMAELRD